MTTVQQSLRAANKVLAAADIPDGPRDARRLMAAALNTRPDRITLCLNNALDAAEEKAFFAKVDDRSKGRPVSHLVGGRDFYDRWFFVNEDVLDPRPETEMLVQVALSARFGDVLDLGTGSGAILVTLLAARPTATGVGTDISQAAGCAWQPAMRRRMMWPPVPRSGCRIGMRAWRAHLT
uniref:Release factor glutamine methyltransferase N-terminal domain-containing protein n=1 Tax=Yoonia rhodophyticola TaxID=3137370 RepID=A0AAN0NL29_9RHOB